MGHGGIKDFLKGEFVKDYLTSIMVYSPPEVVPVDLGSSQPPRLLCQRLGIPMAWMVHRVHGTAISA